jgi:hypothetical protein
VEQIAGIILGIGRWRCGAEVQLCAGDDGGESGSINSCCAGDGRMVIEIGNDRRIIVDAGVDAAALARVLAILESR